jgi:hypothetical protein
VTSTNATAPQVASHQVNASDGSYRFLGEQLSHTTSQWETHGHSAEFAARGERCSACRWTEISLYRVPDTALAAAQVEPYIGGPLGKYLVVTEGRSIVPGERTFVKATWTNSPYDVIEILTQRRGERVTMGIPAARALAIAAEWDDGINDAYVNRAVA